MQAAGEHVSSLKEARESAAYGEGSGAVPDDALQEARIHVLGAAAASASQDAASAAAVAAGAAAAAGGATPAASASLDSDTAATLAKLRSKLEAVRAELATTQLARSEAEDEATLMGEAAQAAEEERTAAVEQLEAAQRALETDRARGCSEASVLASPAYAAMSSRAARAESTLRQVQSEVGVMRATIAERTQSLARAEKAASTAADSAATSFEAGLEDMRQRLTSALQLADAAQAQVGYAAEEAKQTASLRRSLERLRADAAAAEAKARTIAHRSPREALEAGLAATAVASHVSKLASKAVELQAALGKAETSLQAARAVCRDEERNAKIDAALAALAGGGTGSAGGIPAEAASLIASLKAECERLTAAVESARGQAIQRGQALDSMSVELSRVRAEAASAKSDSEALVEELGEALDEVEGASGARKALLEEMTVKDTELQVQAVELSRARQEIVAQSRRGEEAEAARAAVAARLDSLLSEVATAQSLRAQALREFESASLKAIGAEERLTVVEGELSELRNRIGEEAIHGAAASSSSSSSSSSASAGSASGKGSVTPTLSAARAQLATAAARAGDLAAELAKSQAAGASLRGELVRVRSRLEKARERARVALSSSEAMAPPRLARSASAPTVGSASADESLLQYYRSAVRCSVRPGEEKDVALSKCGHCFSHAAVDELISERNRKCPVCGQRFSADDVVSIYLSA
jgi:chromosome segregation ATPase